MDVCTDAIVTFSNNKSYVPYTVRAKVSDNFLKTKVMCHTQYEQKLRIGFK